MNILIILKIHFQYENINCEKNTKIYIYIYNVQLYNYIMFSYLFWDMLDYVYLGKLLAPLKINISIVSGFVKVI